MCLQFGRKNQSSSYYAQKVSIVACIYADPVLLILLAGAGQRLSLQLLQLLLDLQSLWILVLPTSVGQVHMQLHGKEHELFLEATHIVKTGAGKSRI